MKSLAVLFAVTIAAPRLAPAATWSLASVSTAPVVLSGIAPVGGGFVVTGANTLDASQKPSRVLVTKLDDDGTVGWQKLYGPRLVGDIGQFVVPTADDGVLVAAQRLGVHPGACLNDEDCTGAWLFELDASGAIGTERLLETTDAGDVSAAGPSSIQPTPDGGFVLAGSVDLMSGNGKTGALVAKLDGSLTPTWAKRYDVAQRNSTSAIVVTASGYVLAGQTYEPGAPSPNRLAWVVALDTNGGPVWQKRYDVGTNADAVGIASVGDRLVVLITRDPGAATLADAVLLTLQSSDGSVVSASVIGSADTNVAPTAFVPLVGGGTVIASLMAPAVDPTTAIQPGAVVLDAAGQIVAQHTYGTELGFTFGVAPATDGGFVIAADSGQPGGAPTSGGELFRLDALGTAGGDCAALAHATDLVASTLTVTASDTSAIVSGAGISALTPTDTPDDATVGLASVCEAGATTTTTTIAAPGSTTTSTVPSPTACDSIDTCYVALGATLPTLATDVNKRMKRATSTLQRSYKKLGKVLERAAGGAAKKRAARYRSAGKLLQHLQAAAQRDGGKDVLGVSLPAVQAAVAGLRAQLPS